jgi:hypothetical protein
MSLRIVVIAAAIVASVPAIAEAQSDPPMSYASLVVGVQQNHGELGEHFQYGFVGGTEAGVQKRFSDHAIWDLGLAWSLLYGYFPASGDREVDPYIEVIQLEGIVRGRVRLPGPMPLFILAEGGASMYRASLPVPPDNEQIYLGGTAGGGVEIDIGSFVIALGVRYGLFLDGPTGMRIMLRGGLGL